MGIYIKGMTEDQFRSVSWARIYAALKRQNRIVEVPEPHGELIDAVDLIKILDVSVEIEGEENARNVAKAFNEVLDTIRGMSPVIEAEGE